MTSQALSFLLVLPPILVSVRADNEIGVLNALRLAYPDWKPRGIVDVGANGGGWTRAVQEEGLYPGVKTFMVEAFLEHSDSLEETKKKFADGVVDYSIAVLSSTDGDTVKFHSMKHGYTTGNSMFIEQSKHYTDDNAEFELVNTTKLDTLLKHKMEHVDYLKLDVQGAELMVLLGATETLNKVTFVQFEVSVIQYNKGGACWHEVDDLLRRNGFFFYDSSDYVRIDEAFHTKAIGQFDALYIKPSSHHLPSWLVDNKAEFCGSNKEGMGGGIIKDGNKHSEVADVAFRGMMMDANSHFDQTSSVKFFFVAIFAFAVGYFLAGHKSIGRVSSKKLW